MYIRVGTKFLVMLHSPSVNPLDARQPDVGLTGAECWDSV